eukprot:SM000263S09808  [mRNA]  locus=s263:111814:113111:+ [translate_table: standard]
MADAGARLGGSVGTLQISVVEGRDLALPAAAADDAAPHVTLELGPQKAKTKPAANRSDAGGPKWLTDFKLPVSADVSELKVAVVKGDAVVGQASVSLDTVKAKTTVQWYSLRDAAGASAGDICMVIRYINRPAVIPTAAANGTATAKESPRAAVAASAEVDKPAAEAAPSPRTPPPAPQAKAAPAKADAPEPELETKPKPKPAAPKRDGVASKEGQSGGGTNVLLAAGGVLLAVGLAVTATNSRAARKPKYHEVRPGDTLCGIAGEYCVNPDDIFDANTGVTDDPDRIYPGDRLFIP